MSLIGKIIQDLGLFFYIVPISSNYNRLEDVPDYILTAIPYFILLIFLEVTYGKLKGRDLYTVKDTVMSLSLGITQQLVQLWAKEISLVFYIALFEVTSPYRARLFPFMSFFSEHNPHFVAQLFVFVVSFLSVDCGYYWFHRYAHECHALWTSHSVHHSGERYNLATALRQGAVQFLTSWVFYLPFAMLGVSPAQFVRHNRLNTLYQFWIHTEVIGRMPWWFEMIFNTPSHHRLHHRPPGNCNYAGVLIIWDRLFGTFVSECNFLLKKEEDSSISEESTEDYPRGVIYGLAQPLDSYDPVFANIQHIVRIADQATSGNLVDKIKRAVYFMFRKRVHHPLCVTLDCKVIFSDIIFDLEYINSVLPPTKGILETIRITWNRIFRLPPIVNEKQELREKDWGKRDFEFLSGRKQRESPPLTTAKKTIVILHFTATLIGAFLLLLFEGSSFFRGYSGIALKALFSLSCIQSLRMISRHYS